MLTRPAFVPRGSAAPLAVTTLALWGGATITASSAIGSPDGASGEPISPLSSHCPSPTLTPGEAVYAAFDLYNTGFAVAADLDGDGRDEVLAGNLNNDFPYVSIFRTSGARLGLPERVPVPISEPARLVTDDLNGDGAPDLIAWSQFSDAVVGLLNDGTGTLEVAWTQPTNSVQVDVRRGANGRISIVHRRAGAGALDELVLDRNGLPDEVRPITPEGRSHAIAVDANDDGVEDVVIGPYPFSNTLGLFIAEPDGTWTGPIPLQGDMNTNGQIIAADATGDGREDLLRVVPQFGENLVRVIPNAADAVGFDAPFDLVGTSGASALGVFAVAVGDANADGIPDVAGAFGDGVDLFLGQGDGTLERASTMPFYDAGITVAFADLDGDGVDDLVAASRGEDFPSTGAVVAAFGRRDGLPGSVAVSPSLVLGARTTVADADGDGRAERFAGTETTFELQRWDTASRTFVTTDLLATSSRVKQIVVPSGPSVPAGLVLYTLNDADDIFAAIVDGDDLTPSETWDVAINADFDFDAGDFDGDGDLDLIVDVGGSSGVVFLRRDGDTFEPVPDAGLPGPTFRRFSVRDFDDDGLADVLISSVEDASVTIIWGDAEDFVRLGDSVASDQLGARLVVTDWDGDGRPDAVATGVVSIEPRLISFTIDGQLQVAPITLTGATLPLASVDSAYGDIDGAGAIDAVVTFAHGPAPFVGLGCGPVEAPVLDLRLIATPFGTGLGPESGDLDGDGDDEFIIAGVATGTIVLSPGPCAPVCLGDHDANRAVDFLDLLRQLAFIDPDVRTPTAIWDLNDDGVRSFDDLVILLANWGPCR